MFYNIHRALAFDGCNSVSGGGRLGDTDEQIYDDLAASPCSRACYVSGIRAYDDAIICIDETVHMDWKVVGSNLCMSPDMPLSHQQIAVATC